jgi:SAM-dependent methyltransferase
MGACSDDKPQPDFSEAFYRHHAQRYADVSHQFLQSVYIRSSHAALQGDLDLQERLKELVPGRRGLDAGCGAGARDVYHFWQQGYDIYGIDAVVENIEQAKARHPEIADRVAVADLRQPLAYPDASFDFVMCNAVIQHIAPQDAMQVTLCELARVLKPGGILQLMFKQGRGVETVYDRDYGVERSFHLYDEHDILPVLRSYGLELVEADEPHRLGGLMYFTDPKPMEHCVFYARKTR